MSTLQARNDSLEHGDLAALLCIDDAALQNGVIEQLSQLGFAFHTALYPEEVTVRLRLRTYEMVVVSENFAGTDVDSNPVLHEIAQIPLSQRRISFVILIGPGMESRSDMQAFVHSVDLTVHQGDVPNLRAIAGRGIVRQEEFYSALKGVIESGRGGGKASAP